MTEETTFPTQEVVYEIVTDPTEVPAVTEGTEATYPAYTEATETVETFEVVETVDYSPVIAESTSILANIILCAALIIVGVLVAFKFWEAK